MTEQNGEAINNTESEQVAEPVQPSNILTNGFTELEISALNLTIELVHTMVQVIGNSPSRDGDIAEFVALIHPIQHMLMAQVAARVYPDQFRLLGEVLSGPPSA